MSLNTRCPKEALQLAKVLEYHAFMVMNNQDTQALDYIEVKEILRNHFAEVLERMKAKIDKNGAFTKEKVNQFLGLQEQALQTIKYEEDEIGGFMFNSDEEIPEEFRLDRTLEPIATRNGITDKESTEYKAMRKEYKHALNGYISALLSYNEDKSFYDFSQIDKGRKQDNKKVSELRLGHIIHEYLKELYGTIGERSYRDQRDCVNYLLEAFGENHLITDIDHMAVRKVRSMLQNTPTNRNKMPQTKNLELRKQIEVKDTLDLKVMSKSNVNKYMGYMSGLFGWAKNNKYVDENPFKGMRLKQNKKEVKRKPFKAEQVATILGALSKMDTTKALEKTRYWSAMIAIYTGARLNEIASLTPDDIKQDEVTGGWYFDITDEEESKKIKTEAGRRIVPVHPNLIELGLLEYIKHARKVIAKMPKVGEHPTRLMYQLTYTDEGWGRKVGSWFNNSKNGFLLSLGLKTEKTTLHSLRHSFITYLNNAGVEPPTIKSLVGHEQGTVTFGVYAHFGVEHLPVSSKAIEKLPY